ncbi:MAG: zonular occludens toxin domain-containing protein [Alistipes sp.]|nr:zonular occludens toxin domain-containing protein [Alistipes sp.]
MIELYSGTPGSGKSLNTTRRIYFHVESGLPVIANFDVNLVYLEKHLSMFRVKGGTFLFKENWEITPQFLLDYSSYYFLSHKFKEGKILLILDECQLLFNAREWDAKNRKEWLSFFTQHRHLGYDIILACQWDRMIDRQLRCLIEFEYKHRKLSNLGKLAYIVTIPFRHKLFAAVKFYYPLKEKVGISFFTCRKKYYKIYDTLYLFKPEDNAVTVNSSVEEIGGWGDPIDSTEGFELSEL